MDMTRNDFLDNVYLVKKEAYIKLDTWLMVMLEQLWDD